MMAGIPARAATRLEIIMSVLERVFVLTWGGQSIRSSRTNRGGETKGEQIKITTSLPTIYMGGPVVSGASSLMQRHVASLTTGPIPSSLTHVHFNLCSK